MKRLSLLILLSCGLSALQAQTKQVDIHQDSVISMLQEFRAQWNLNPEPEKKITFSSRPVDKTNATRVKIRGFRVQIFSRSSRNDAYGVQSKFKSQYKGYESYLSYEEPNYRVKVGDFRSRAEANRFREVLRNRYSNVFVISEDVWVYQ